MRTTEIRCAQNIGAQFRALWLIQGRRRIANTGAEAILASKGIKVVDPKEILTPPYHKEKEIVDVPPPPGQQVVTEPNEQPCYVFTNKFSPIGAVSQVQLLTNSLVQSSLPDAILGNAGDNTAEEDERVKEAILHAHLLDSHQEKLPKVLDVINNPGWKFKREYGIPLKRRNKSLTYQLLLLLDQLFPEGTSRHLVEDALTRVTLTHSDRLMQLNLRAAFILTAPKPLGALVSPSEVRSLDGEPLPDIYPLSPFINCRPRNNYSLSDAYGVGSSRVHPHTIFIHHNEPRMRGKEEHFQALSLLHGFAHAASYAKHFGKTADEDLLAKPVVVQVVHTNGCQYHISAFQLNTLNLTGPTKNIFWTQPWEALFGSCTYEGTKPALREYNPRVFSLLKGVYANA
ncbi:39S ribosomal protein L37, mitochondrial-like [Penaeus japonicus]|uniref:39S ribosomal protein L37, mitochondrial-like n=1 Tax=Penaeus japonicus TaxID=27405 RepID=UPI001C70ED08|nr:39S ribosomal protein L37, mitochondrial-like [Penaeus japonicus]